MTSLPEWLWPQEDEEAVQEAERLIEETHNTLRRMEADMHVQGKIGLHISEKRDKLKFSLQSKINSLEKEMRIVSEARGSPSSCTQLPGYHNTKPLPGSNNFSDTLPINETKVSSKIRGCPSGQHPPPIMTSSQHMKNKNPKTNVNTAESVVLTARAKVEDALAMARNVTASLQQYTFTPSHHSKPLSTNIGVFEVKSNADIQKTPPPKLRLQPTFLPSISIKRGLEKQSIPSIQVSPGEKVIPVNVSVFSVKHNEEPSKQPTLSKNENSEKETNSKLLETEHEGNKSALSSKLEGAISQLTQQLSEVEELREVNQSQVNHVLQFLLSRICLASQPDERLEKPSTNMNTPVNCNSGIKETSPTSVSSSSSSYSIAYDSLSRFLETYKRAAEQNMRARKRAVAHRQRVAVKQKRDVEEVQNSTENHLLIGPLRRAVKLVDPIELTPSEIPDSSVFTSKPKPHNAEISGSKDNARNGDGRKILFSGQKDLISDSSDESHRSSTHESSALQPVKSSEDISGSEYEDDWEEEDLHKQDEKPTDSSLHPIAEVEEQIFSSVHSNVDESPANSLGKAMRSLNVSPIPKATLDEGQTRVENEDNFGHVQLSVETEKNALDHPLLNYSNDIILKQVQQDDENVESSKTQEDSHRDKIFAKSISEHKIAEDTSGSAVKMNSENAPLLQQNVKPRHHQSIKEKTGARTLSSCSSSSDNDVKSGSRPHHSNRWDLSLREDLQLQSAILLNWQLEDRWKSRSSGSSLVKDSLVMETQQKDMIADVEKRWRQTLDQVDQRLRTNDSLFMETQQKDMIADVEKRWQQTLDQVDQRLKTIEDNERITRIANDIKKQAREDQTSITEAIKILAREKSEVVVLKENRIVTKDQVVQTSPDKYAFALPCRESEKVPDFAKDHGSKFHFPGGFNIMGISRGHQMKHPSRASGDLTSELLAYSRMGILNQHDFSENPRSKSPSSSASSQFPCSSAVVSLSEGEVGGSATGSCSCSDGEFCVCGGRKFHLQHAPPDGSHTFRDGENFLKDVSQGEIPPSQIKYLLGDTSHGEIGTQFEVDLVEELCGDSDGIEWETR